MWVWHELRIEPTPEALAIKRAYAKRLKHTRPDDDAVGYQRLREAYEQALEWARHAALAQGEDDADDDDAARAPMPTLVASAADPGATRAPVREQDLFADTERHHAFTSDDGVGTASSDRLFTHTGDSTPSANASQPTLDDTPPTRADDGFAAAPIHAAQPDDDANDTDDETGNTTWITPEAIARALLAFRDEHGDDALVDLWPRVRDDLDTIPLSMRDHASDVMAHMVLDHLTLPSPVVEALAHHFQWGTDFRSVRAMPQARARALMAHLRELGILRINDPDVLHRFRAVRHLDALRSRGSTLRALLLALLLPERVFERWRGLSVHMRRGLGIGAESAHDIGRWLLIAAFLRTSALAMLLAWIFSTMPDLSTENAVSYGLLTTLALLIAAIGASWVRLPLDQFHAALHRRWPRLADPPGHARFAFAVVLACIAGMLAAAAQATIGAPASLVLWLAIACTATVPIWSHRNPWLAALIPSTLVLYVALRMTIPEPVPAIALASVALVWTLVALWIATRAGDWVIAVYRNPFATFRPTAAWGWILWIVFFKGVLAFAALATVLSLPLTLMVQARGFGLRFACASVAIAGAITFAVRAHGDALPLLLPLLLVPIALATLQWIANGIARSQLFR